MTDLKARLEALAAKAQPTPWEACDPGDYGDFDGESRVICSADPNDMRRIAVVHWSERHPETDANAVLIAELRNALPEIIAALSAAERVEELSAGLESVKIAWIANNAEGDDYDEGYDDALKHCHDIAVAILAKQEQK